MKRKLEAELISIAHRILKLKNKSEVIQLHQETQKLYEKLSVLRFVEENFENAKPTIGLTEIEKEISRIFDEEPIEKKSKTKVNQGHNEGIVDESFADTFIETANQEETPEIILNEITEEETEWVSTEEIASEPIVDEEVEDETIEKEEIIAEPTVAEEPFFKPAFELAFDIKEEAPKTETAPISNILFEDFLGPNYTDPVFVKPEEIERDIFQLNYEKDSDKKVINLNAESKMTTLNDQASKGITIGLNDRVAFIKHLFSSNTEDYNRVLSQLITFDSIQEVEYFINDMVKPDYNNWEGKDEYAIRFMDAVSKKFL